jgi:hypothetical protein
MAGIMLKAVPTLWVNQYNLTHLTLPKSLRLLLPDLENIERVMNKKHVESVKARGKDGTASAGAKSSPKKRAYTGSGEQVPKKVCSAKFCQHCKNNDGPYTSHNTKECHKSDKDGKAVAATGKEPYKKKPYKKDGGGNDKQLAFLTDAIESLVKKGLNSLTAKSVLAGTKNSCSEGFWLAKLQAHKHPHHGEAVSISNGMGLVDPPNPMQGRTVRGVGGGRR